MEKSADKTIITVVGKDTVGIIAKVCIISVVPVCIERTAPIPLETVLRALPPHSCLRSSSY